MILTLFTVIFALSIIFLFALWIMGVYYQMMMIKNRKEGVGFFDSRLLFNIFNVQLFGLKYLTEKGVTFRNKSWICFGLFVAIIATIMGIAKAMGAV